ncbi:MULTISPECIES: hypothetical protein [unclassified Nonomuraea]|uniref:hypothetical protein n=1 Tax=unclassified Nonomuraea TaxID=2593643 RepID=UPI00340D25C2
MTEGLSWGADDLVGGPVDKIFAALRKAFADIEVERISKTHAADDDNVWFIRRRSGAIELQLDSMPNGDPPFLLESDSGRAGTSSVEEAITLLISWLW